MADTSDARIAGLKRELADVIGRIPSETNIDSTSEEALAQLDSEVAFIEARAVGPNSSKLREQCAAARATIASRLELFRARKRQLEKNNRFTPVFNQGPRRKQPDAKLKPRDFGPADDFTPGI